MRNHSQVSQANLANAAIIILGHGSSFDPAAGAPAYQHAAELRRQFGGVEVREAFWKQEPQIEKVLAEIKAARVLIVPLFISEGYFSEQVIPQRLGFSLSGTGEAGRVQRKDSRVWVYCHVVGTHPLMTEVLLSRASEVVKRFPFPRAPKPASTTLVIAGHGTEQNANSRMAIERQIELLRERGVYAAVEAVFLDEEPKVARYHELAKTDNVVVVPFFISEGPHVAEDIPMALGTPERMVKQRREAGQPAWRNPTEKQGKRVWYAEPVGTDKRVADIILARAAEGLEWSEG